MSETKPFKKGYKYRIYPTEEQKVLLAKTFGSCRYLWNRVLTDTQSEYQQYLLAKESTFCREKVQHPSLSGNSLTLRIPKIASDPETAWMQEVSSVALQQTMHSLGTAYDNFFRVCKITRHVGHPKFKKKYGKQSFRLVGSAFRLKDSDLYIAKSKDPLPVVWSRDLPSKPTSLTISKTPSGEYYVSFICEYFPEKTSGTGQVGIDVGLTTYATFSNGETVDNPRWLKTHLQSLRRSQQTLSRRKKGSKNYHKARIKVAKLHQKVSASRHDWQHKATRTLVNNNHVIGVESLKVINLIRNRKLSRAIQDVAWSSFFYKLQYKVIESRHATLVYMHSYFPSSHLCSVTGEKLDRKLKLSERTWDCSHCGCIHDRDLNAALNIEKKAMGLYRFASITKDLSGQVCVIGDNQ